MSAKEKGLRFERELIDLLWECGFAAVRVAGSGVSSFPCPDIIASNGKITFAFEVKSRSKLPLYLDEREVKDLAMFSTLFGAKPYIALRLLRMKWKFVELEKLEKTSKGYRIDENIFSLAPDLEEITGKSFQLRLL